MKTLLTLCFIVAGFAGLGSPSAQAEETTHHHYHHTSHHYHHMRHHRHHHPASAQKPAAENGPASR